jgi:hypothetical protein
VDLYPSVKNAEQNQKLFFFLIDNNLVRSNQGSIPTFDGNLSKYTMWCTKFKAYTNISGFSDAIRENPSPDMPTSWFDKIDLATETGKKQFVAIKMNDLAMASFTMGFTREKCDW